MHMLSILIYDYCIIAETVLHVEQVPMLVLYIGIVKVKGFWPNPKIGSIFTINLTVQQYSQAP